MSSPAFDVALDAMGGDRAPEIPVEAAVRAARTGVRVLLVGDEARLTPLLRAFHAPTHAIEVVHAGSAVEMDEKPSMAVRRKRDASIRVAAELVASDRARVLISAGNSGAVMAAGLLAIGRIPGVERPAIAAAIPTLGAPTILVDLGANVDPSPLALAQFGVMGAAYARVVFGRPRPKVALLSNGHEEQKGTDRTRAAHALLAQSQLDYQGPCEGRDLFSGKLDVIVTDGFTGNVLLKAMEGFVSAVTQLVKREIQGSITATAGAVFLRSIGERLKKRLDYEEAGAAPLLGLSRRCFVAHGASSVGALTNAILAAHRHGGPELVRAIERDIEAHQALGR